MAAFSSEEDAQKSRYYGHVWSPQLTPWPSLNYEAMQEVYSIQTCALGQFRQARRPGLVQAGPWCQSSPTPCPAFRGPEERTTPTPPGAPVWTVMSAAADLVLRYVGGVVGRAHLCYSLLFQLYLCQMFLITQRLVFLVIGVVSFPAGVIPSGLNRTNQTLKVGRFYLL